MSVTLLNLTATPDVDRTSDWLRSMAHGLAYDVSALLSGLGVALASLDADDTQALTEDDREALSLARHNARCMRALVTDYVELQRFVERHGGVADEIFDVEEMLRQAGRSAAIAQVDLSIACEDGVSSIRGDRQLTVHAVSALLRSFAPPQADLERRVGLTIVARHRRDEVEISIRYGSASDAALAGTGWRAATVVHEFFRNAVLAQGGEAHIGPPTSRHDLACFTLPSALEADTASIAAA